MATEEEGAVVVGEVVVEGTVEEEGTAVEAGETVCESVKFSMLA